MVDRVLGALRSPTAGNTGGTAWVVLQGSDQTAVYFDATTDEVWRSRNREWADGLTRAPVVLLAYTSPDAYVARYAEPDKASAGLGAGEAAWPVPYWIGDAAFGVMTVLLGAVDAGLGACILGTFRGEAELAAPARCRPRVGASSVPCCSATPTAATTVRRRCRTEPAGTAPPSVVGGPEGRMRCAAS